MSLLTVENLSVVNIRNGEKILNNISFNLEKNSCLGIVGESGSGKSMLCKSILSLTDPWIEVNGTIRLNGEEIDQRNKKRLREIRGKSMSMILQNPMTAFDPLYTIGYHITETLCENMNFSKKEAKVVGIDSLKKMGIHEPESVIKKYPHQLSGGMLQRCMIAIALAIKPDIIIADEPTTALDSINQREVIEQFEFLQKETGTSLIFVSHDLGAVKRLANQILVIKNGHCVEYSDAEQIFKRPKDLYTRYLVETRIALSKPFENIMNTKVEDENVKSARCI